VQERAGEVSRPGSLRRLLRALPPPLDGPRRHV
jgi:hypothetical protein